MNWKILFKAMKFSLLPTLLTFTLLFLGFMSFEKAFNFLTGNDFLSMFVRVGLFIAEIALIFTMYEVYSKEEYQKSLLNPENLEGLNFTDRYSDNKLKELFNQSYNGSYRYSASKTKDSDFVIVKQTQIS
jgi:hypothetical protein